MHSKYLIFIYRGSIFFNKAVFKDFCTYSVVFSVDSNVLFSNCFNSFKVYIFICKPVLAIIFPSKLNCPLVVHDKILTLVFFNSNAVGSSLNQLVICLYSFKRSDLHFTNSNILFSRLSVFVIKPKPTVVTDTMLLAAGGNKFLATIGSWDNFAKIEIDKKMIRKKGWIHEKWYWII